MNAPRYKLSPGAQVREEEFGLLFYSMHGPRLYFLSSGNLIPEEFFQGHVSLETWINKNHVMSDDLTRRMHGLQKSLKRMVDKGVIIEC